MILILSKEQGEGTTEEVMDWLYALDCDFQRLNGDHLRHNPFKISVGNSNSFVLNNYDKNIIQKDTVHTIWNRRWNDGDFLGNSEKSLNKDFSYEMKRHLLNEFNRLSQYIFHHFSGKNWIDKNHLIQPNKIVVLETAKDCQLNIPNTIITNNKQDTLNFLKENGRICTKPINEISGFLNTKKKRVYLMDTKEVKKDTLESLEEIFFPSLFQKLVEKKFDIRVFYLDRHFYPMAIFSQRREKSVLDFRNYNFADPDRSVPYSLPTHIENKLQLLVDKIGYKHCSIDMIKDTNNEYFFLEINPVGQFGMVSKPCNYNLEMEVAIYLKKEYEKG